jgi:hypothetical protein
MSVANVVYRKEINDVRLTVYEDVNPESPRSWSNIGTMVCGHRKYKLGDRNIGADSKYRNWDEWLQGEVLRPNGGEDNVVYLPLYLYDHGGLAISTTGFGDSWDSGQVGWIYVTKRQFDKKDVHHDYELMFSEEAKKRTRELLQKEVELYNDYLQGNVYGFVLEQKKTCDCCGAVRYEEIESCWGFYGDGAIKDMKNSVAVEYQPLFAAIEEE